MTELLLFNRMIRGLHQLVVHHHARRLVEHRPRGMGIRARARWAHRSESTGRWCVRLGFRPGGGTSDKVRWSAHG
jgi:hypothetical protein